MSEITIFNLSHLAHRLAFMLDLYGNQNRLLRTENTWCERLDSSRICPIVSLDSQPENRDTYPGALEAMVTHDSGWLGVMPKLPWRENIAPLCSYQK